MSKSIQALEAYTRAENARRAFMQEHKDIFDKVEALGMASMDADSALRDAVAEEKESVQNEHFIVTATPQTQTYADIEVIDNLIAGGIIPAAKRADIVKTVERPIKITIRPQR